MSAYQISGLGLHITPVRQHLQRRLANEARGAHIAAAHTITFSVTLGPTSLTSSFQPLTGIALKFFLY